MGGPWERYGGAEEAPEGPWARFATPGQGEQAPLDTAVNAMRTFNNWLLPGLGPTYEGAVNAGAAALRGGDPLQAFRAGRARNEAGMADLRARNPALSVGAGTVGGLLPGILTAGATPAAQASAQVTQNLTRSPAMNFARDAVTGAAVNAPIGALTSIDRPENIGQATLQAGAAGAVAGPAIGAIAQRGLFPLLDAGVNAATRAPRITVDPNALGAMGGNLRMLPPQPQTVREGVSNNIVRMARRERLTPARVDETMAAHTEAGQRPLLAQVLGEAGLQRGQTLASVPGQTPRVAADVIRGRQRTQREGVERLFNNAAPGRNRPIAQAEAALNTARQDVNREAFTPALNQRPDPRQAGRINQILGRIPQRVLERANNTIDELAQLDGLDPSAINEGQRLYYTKRALSNTIEEMGREGLGSDLRASYTRLADEYTNALQDAMPGLRPAMEQFRDVAKARDVLEASRNFLRMSPDELTRLRENASPIEREYAEVGWRDYVNAVLDRNRDGHANVAEMFATDAFRLRTEALLGEERAAPLLRALRTRSDDFRDLSSLMPRRGAKTAPMFADFMDQSQGVPSSNAAWIRAALDAVRNPLAEHSRNIEGRALFQEMTPERALALKQALIDAGIRLRPADVARTTAPGLERDR